MTKLKDFSPAKELADYLKTFSDGPDSGCSALWLRRL